MVRTVSVYTADAEGSYNGKSWNASASRRCWSVLCKIFFKIYLADVYGTLIGASILGSRKEERLRKIWSWLLILEFFIQAVYVRTFFEAGIISTFFFLGIQMQLL